MSPRLPVLFIGHGNPLNALADNVFTRAWRRLGESVMPRPRAVLCISAHWYLPGVAVTAMPRPRTIHDFGGFPQALFDFDYPAPGDPALAAEVRALLGDEVTLDHGWGFDHGTWSVLCHMFPQAGVPVIQLGIDETRTAQWHYQAGRRLAALRDRGVLIVGSGNLVHNLHAYAWGRVAREPYDWALRFETQARAWMSAGEHAPLIGYEALGRDAALSAPTPEHFLPLLYVLGAQLPGDAVTFPVDGVDGGSVSMLSVRVG